MIAEQCLQDGFLMSNNEETIRQLAHQIWEAEGKPEGRAHSHWEKAINLATGAKTPEQLGLQRSQLSLTAHLDQHQPDQT